MQATKKSGHAWGLRLAGRLEELGWSMADLARRLEAIKAARGDYAGTEEGRVPQPARIQRLTNRIYKWPTGAIASPRGQIFADVANALGVSEQWLRYGGENISPLRQETIAPRHGLVHPPAFTASIPILGVVMGGENGVPVFSGEEVDRVEAPAPIADVKGAYGLYVVCDSMNPVFRQGMVVIVNPHLPPNREDDVVVHFKKHGDGGKIYATLKRYISRDDKFLTVEQFNPPKKIRYAIGEVVNVHTIVWGKRR